MSGRHNRDDTRMLELTYFTDLSNGFTFCGHMYQCKQLGQLRVQTIMCGNRAHHLWASVMTEPALPEQSTALLCCWYRYARTQPSSFPVFLDHCAPTAKLGARQQPLCHNGYLRKGFLGRLNKFLVQLALEPRTGTCVQLQRLYERENHIFRNNAKPSRQHCVAGYYQ